MGKSDNKKRLTEFFRVRYLREQVKSNLPDRRAPDGFSTAQTPESQSSRQVQDVAEQAAGWGLRRAKEKLFRRRRVSDEKRRRVQADPGTVNAGGAVSAAPEHTRNAAVEKTDMAFRRTRQTDRIRMGNRPPGRQAQIRQPVQHPAPRLFRRRSVRQQRRLTKQVQAALNRTRKAAAFRRQQKAAAKAGKQGARLTVKAVRAGVKAVAAAGKTIGALIAAGGAGLLCIILVAALIAILLASGFGLFFANESGSSMTIQAAMAAINQEYVQRLDEIQSEQQPYDSVAVYGSKPAWRDVLAVYAVLTTNDAENPMDVATMDEDHLERLSSVFWQMTSVTAAKSQSTHTEEVEVEVIGEETGQPTGETETVYQEVTTTILQINVSGKTAEQMAADLNIMTNDMRVQLEELLSAENEELWAELLGSSWNGSVGTLEEDAAQVASYLLGLGFTIEATAAILGNIKAECGWNYSTIGVLDGIYHPYERNIGIFQFTTTSPDPNSGDEYWRFMNWCEANGLFYGDLDAQLRWVFSGEPGTSDWTGRWMERGRYYDNAPGFSEDIYEHRNVTPESFMAETNVAYATYSWMAFYEGCTNGTGFHLDRRLAYAYEYYDQLMTTSAVSLIWPVNSTRITSYFGPRKSPGGVGSTDHKGIDIAADTGAPIFAAAGGTVTLASYSDSAGNWIRIDHGNGICTTYMHCYELYVTRGQVVNQGDIIAAVGSTGHSTGPHLDFRVEVDGVPQNPLDYVTPG